MKNIIEKILNNNIFKAELAKICELEKNRLYCGHDLEHLLTVCRLAYIDVLVNNSSKAEEVKDMLYAAGLLHDIGRAREYETGVGHDIAGQELARKILLQCDCTESYVNLIVAAIGEHRNNSGDEDILYSRKAADKNDNSDISDIISRAIRKADKKSRNCFDCQGADTCKWPMEKRNRTDNLLL